MCRKMTFGRWLATLFPSFLMAILCGEPAHPAEALKVVQQPTFWIVGQWTRFLIQTPADCGPLEVACPEQVVLLDRWPHRPGDTLQRFYFRAKAPLEKGEILFRSGELLLAVPVRILSWEQVLKERFEVEINPGPFGEGATWRGRLTLPRLFPMEGEDTPKAGLTFLTRDEIEKQRADLSRNLKEQADRNVVQAEDLEALFTALPESTIPRAVYVNNRTYQKGPNPSSGCPVCGTKIFEGRSPFYPWVLDPGGHPFKIQCPECQRWFPSNDFASGDMHRGEFPDDGWGYFDAAGRPYSFIGYYVLQFYRDYRLPDLYSRYYLASGDQRWARATALLLFRIAEQYLNLALNINQRERYTRDALWSGTIPPQGTPPPSHGTWFAPGFYLDGIWSIGRERQYGAALERIWDYFEQEDPVLLRFLQTHHHPEIRTLHDVRRFIEIGYFRTVAQGLLDRVLSGNGPAEQAMALRMALILNTPRAIELVEWAFNNPAKGMRYYLSNSFFKDGAGYESPGYNQGHYGSTAEIADLLTRLVSLRPEQYARARFPLLTDDPKFKYIYDHNIHATLISRTYANVGDDGDLADTDPLPLRVGASLSRSAWVRAFERWPNEIPYAQALWDAEANAPIRELTDPALRARVTEIIKQHGPYLDLPSQVLDGFGHVILRSGKGEHQRAFWMRYGTMFGHGHHDGLTIGFEALRRTLLPEQGYFRGEAHRTEWDMNWALHYCGRIVGASKDPKEGWGPQGRYGGSLCLFADGGWAKVATAKRRLYQEIDPPKLVEMADDLLLERTIALVDLSPEHSYAVSIFRLVGGTDHYLSFHGPRGTAVSEGLRWVPQQGGTLAGPEVPYGLKWDSEWSRQNPHLMMFPFLYDVHRARSEGPWWVRWDLERYPQVHLRLHALGPVGEEVALCKGKPPGGGKPYELQWVMRHTHGPEPLSTPFVEVLEAYEGEPLIREVRPLAVRGTAAGAQRPVAFQVVVGNRLDTILYCPNPSVPAVTANGITLRGQFGIWSEEGGRLRRVWLVGGTQIAKGGERFTAPAAFWSGKITSAHFRQRKIVVSPALRQPERLVGRYARITNAQGNDATHLIVGARSVRGGTELTFALDPRIGEGPIQEIHADGLTSAVRLLFSGLYYKGKTLSNEDQSVTYPIHGAKDSRIYINTAAHLRLRAESVAREFTDKDGDGIAHFFLYDYGPGDTVTVPHLLSVERNEPTLE